MSVVKVSVREARQHFRRLLDQVQTGDEVVVLRRGVEVGRLTKPRRKSARLPDLTSFRASIEVSGRPLSHTIIEARRRTRY